MVAIFLRITCIFITSVHFQLFVYINPLGSAPKTEAVVVTGNTSNAVRILRTVGETYQEGPERVADVALDNKNRVMFRVKCSNINNCKVVKTMGWFAQDVSINEFDIKVTCWVSRAA